MKDDTTFNESFATAVEQLALQQWLQDGGRQHELARWTRHDDWVEAFTEWLLRWRKALQAIYDNAGDDSDMHARKEALFLAMKLGYPAFRDARQGDSSFDVWMSRPLNNASLLSMGSYNDWVSELFSDCDGNWPAFYTAAERLAAQEHETRTVALERLRRSSLL